MCRRIVPLLLVLIGVYFSSRALAQAPREIQWRYDYNTARKEAQDKNLPIFIDFRMDGCPPCDKMEKVTFQDAKVSELLADKFICLKINGPKEQLKGEKNLNDALGIKGYPTIVLASPDGKILMTQDGFKDPVFWGEQLERIVGTSKNFDWMLASLKEAQKSMEGRNYALAIPTLQKIKEMGQGRPAQAQAINHLNDLEQLAQQEIAKAKKFQEKNMPVEATQAYMGVVRDFPGLQAAREAADLVTSIAQSQDHRNQERTRQAREHLALAKDFMKNKEYNLSLYYCDKLKKGYADLPEAQEAHQMANDIGNNPAIMENACDNLSDQLAKMYLQLSDSYLKKGQRQQGINYLERVIISFPGSTHAESAQIRRSQLQGTAAVPAIPANFKQGQ